MKIESLDKNRGKVRGRRGKAVLSPAEGIKRSIGAKIDVQLWRRLRALAIKQGKRSGELLDEAIEGYLGKHGG